MKNRNASESEAQATYVVTILENRLGPPVKYDQDGCHQDVLHNMLDFVRKSA